MFVEINNNSQIEKVVKLANLIWPEAYQDILSTAQIKYMLEKFLSVATIKQQINQGISYNLINFENEIVGFYAYQLKTTIFLSKLYILKEYRQKGLAKKVIENLTKHQIPMTVNVNKNNKKALAAYSKMGFKIIDEQLNEIGSGFFMDDFVLEKSLSFLDLITLEKEKPYFKSLLEKIAEEAQTNIIYPARENWFKALELTPFEQVKVVLIGQDPYHNPRQAMGLSFSVNKGVDLPPSLVNIYEEIKREYGFEMPNHGDLTKWAKQGVLLLNSILTVSANRPLSHQHFGWQNFTDQVVKLLQQKQFVVYLLLGKYAQSYQTKITNKNHLILKTSHPSPLSNYRGFSGSGIFKKTNDALKAQKLKPINWYLL